MEQFPNNSAKPPRDYSRPGKVQKAEVEQPQEEPRTEKVVTTKVIRREKSFGKRVSETFFSGEGPRTVFGNVLWDVLVPGARDVLFAGSKEYLERTFYGDLRPATRAAVSGVVRRGVETVASTRYDKVAVSSPARGGDPRLTRKDRSTHNFETLVIEHRVEAEEILTRMYDLLERYEEVKVADLYNMLDVTPEHTDYKWGWNKLTGAQVLRHRGGGYVLDLPPTEVLD